MMDFPCTSCGECCKNIGSGFEKTLKTDVPLAIKDLIEQFPYKLDENGACSMLNEDNSCSVYDNRPIICNIKLAAKLLHIDEYTWFKQNADACNDLIRSANLDDRYLVTIGEQKTYKEADKDSKKGTRGNI